MTVETKTCGAHPRSKGGCGETKPVSEFPKKGGICLACRREREGRPREAAPSREGSLAAKVDALETYAEKVDPDAPERLGTILAGMRRAAEVLDGDRPQAQAWTAYTQLSRQAQDVLASVYGSRTVDHIDRLRELIADDDAEPLSW